MITSQGYIDGSWKLKVISEDFSGVVYFRVFNNTKLNEVIGNISRHFNISKEDLKNIVLWCPSKNNWVFKTELTLHQLSLNANTQIVVMKKIRQVYIQLPNKEEIIISIDYSQPLLKIMKMICSELKQENPYMFTLMKSRESFNPINVNKSKIEMKKSGKYHNSNIMKDYLDFPSIRKRFPKHLNNNCPWTPTSGYGSLSIASSLDNCHGSIYSFHENPLKISNGNNINNKSNINLAFSQRIIDCKIENEFKSINKDVLLYSKSLMEQKIDENSLLKLKIKYIEIKNIEENISEDLLNILYEQINDSLLIDEMELDNKVRMIFAALRYQSIIICVSNDIDSIDTIFLQKNTVEEEIDKILTTLERDLLLEMPINFTKSIRISIQIMVQQINPKFIIQHSRNLRLTLNNSEITVFKESDTRNIQYLFNVKECKFSYRIGENFEKNLIKISFIYLKKLFEIYINFFDEKDFIALNSILIIHSTIWEPTSQNFDEMQTIIRKVINITRCNEISAYNIFNMPRVELKDLLGQKLIKKENVRDYLKEILQYHCCFKGLTSKEAKLQYITLFGSLPYYNYTYFHVNVLSVNPEKRYTIIAVNPEMFILFDYISHKIPILIFPWKMLKKWSTNSDVNIIDLHFRPISITISTIDCPSLCLHELISFYIWYSSCTNNSYKKDKFLNLLDIINGKCC